MHLNFWEGGKAVKKEKEKKEKQDGLKLSLRLMRRRTIQC